METTSEQIRTIEAKVVGVSYEGRQTIVAKLRRGELLRLRREPDNPYDRNAVRVERSTGEQVGYLARELASRLAPGMDAQSEPLPAVVTAIVGGYLPCHSLGVRIRFAVTSDDRSTSDNLTIVGEPIDR